MQKLLVLLPSNRGIFVSLWTCHELKLTPAQCELEGKIKLRYTSELELDLFFKFIKISELICELKISFDLLYNSDPDNKISCSFIWTQTIFRKFSKLNFSDLPEINIQSCIKFKKFRSRSAHHNDLREKIKIKFTGISELDLSFQFTLIWCDLKFMVRSRVVQCPLLKGGKKNAKALSTPSFQ